MLILGLLILAAAPAGAAAGAGPEIACAYDALTPAARKTLARDYSLETIEAGNRISATLTPLVAACSDRYAWDDAHRRWAGDYAGQRAELEARAAALPAAAPADRLGALFDSLPEGDRKGMGDLLISDADFRAIGLRLRDRFDAAGIPRGAQGQAAGYFLALSHLRAIEAAWAALPAR